MRILRNLWGCNKLRLQGFAKFMSTPVAYDVHEDPDNAGQWIFTITYDDDTEVGHVYTGVDAEQRAWLAYWSIQGLAKEYLATI